MEGLDDNLDGRGARELGELGGGEVGGVKHLAVVLFKLGGAWQDEP